MSYFNYLLEFSHHNCVAICAFLVPAILLTTLYNLAVLFVFINQAKYSNMTALIANTLSLVICLHVASWFIVGVIMPQTFILLGLAITCFVINFWVVKKTKEKSSFPLSLGKI